MPATNLHPWSTAYYADPAVKDGPPAFSLAFLEVVTKDNRDEAEALAFPLRGSLRRDKTCAALSDFFAGKGTMDAALWRTALDEAMKGEDLACRHSEGDARVSLEVTVGSGDVLPGVRE